MSKKLSIGDAAKMLGVSINTLRNWDTSGKLSPVRTSGGQRRYRLEDLEVLITKPHVITSELPVINQETSVADNQLSTIIPNQTPLFFGFLKSLVFPTASILASGFVVAGTIFVNNPQSVDFAKGKLAEAGFHFAQNWGPKSANVAPTVLAAETTTPDYRFLVNVPAIFSQNITAPNVVYSITAGTGVTVTAGQTPTISVTDQTGTLQMYKTIKVGDTEISAGSKTDTFTFAAGDNVTLSADSTNKKLTIAATTPTLGITDDGSIVRLTTATDNFAIGAASGAAKLNINTNDNTDLFTASKSGNLVSKLDSNGVLTTTGLLPLANNLYDIGSSSLQWLNLYVDTIHVNNGVVSWLQRNSGAVAPTNITDDFLIGGTSTASATFRVSSAGVITAGTYNGTKISESYGGTNQSTYTTGDILYASSANTLSKLAIGSTDQMMVVSSGGIPSWTSNPGAGGTGVFGYWQRNAGALAPANLTDDFLVGGTSTASAKFAIVSGSGNITSTGTLTLPNSNSLTGQSGNLQFSQGISVGGGTTYYVNTSGNANFNTLNAATTTLGGTTVTSLLNSGSASVSGGLILYGVTTVSSTNKQTLTIGDSSTGNIAFGQPITSGTWNGSAIGAVYGGTGQSTYTTGDLLYSSATNTLSKLAVGTPNQILSVSGSNIPAWIDTTSVGSWQRNAGAVAPLNITDDVLVGGISTASATFRISSAGVVTAGTWNGTAIANANLANSSLTINTGNSLTGGATVSLGGSVTLDTVQDIRTTASPAFTNLSLSGSASVSGGLTLYSTPTISATALQNLNLGDSNTGYVNIGASRGLTATAIQLTTGAASGYALTSDASGNASWTDLATAGNAGAWTLSGSTTFPDSATYNVLVGSASTADDIGKFTVSGAKAGKALVVLNQTGEQNILVASAAGVTKFVLDNTGTITTGIWNGTTIVDDYGGTGQSTYTTGDMLYASGTDTLAKRAIGSGGQVLTVSGGVPTWTDATAVGDSTWQRNTGTVAPLNITDDVLVGGIATSSAKFSISGTTGSASSAGNLTFSSAATIATTGRQTLTIGDGNTGLINISSTMATGNAVSVTNNSLTTGTGLYLTSTSTGLSTGGLQSIDWSPGSATTTTGDLFKINIGTNGTAANLFNVLDTGSSLFSVSETAVTANLPVNFTSPGDVNMAYDLNFTNATSSYVKSAAPLYVQAGEIFNSSDLTLRTFNKGNTIVDSEAFVTNYAATVAGKLVVGTTTPSPFDIGNFYLTNSATTGKALAILNQTEGQDLFTASASGTTKFTISNAGNLTTTGTITLPNSNTLTGASGYVQASAGISVGGGTTYYINNLGTANLNAVTVNSTLAVTGATTLTGALTANSTASVSGSFKLFGTPTIQSTANQTLTLGGDTTGNIALMPLNGSGNVGIGTTSPADKLHILGAKSSITQPTTGGLIISDSTALSTGAGGVMTFRGKYTSGGSETTAASIHAYKENATDNEYGFSLAFNTRVNGGNNTEKMRIDSTGNVGIGTTAPTALLQVAGTASVSGAMTLYGTPTINTTANMDLTLDPTGTQVIVADDLQIQGGDLTTNQTTATLFNTTATTLSLGGAATTALNLGNGSGNYTAINLGSGTGTHVINIAGTGATAADTINIGTGGTGADTINLGSSASTTALNFTSGTGSQTFASSVATGTTTTSAFVFTANSLTTGTGLYLSSTATGLSSGGLQSIDWSPGSATTTTGDLFKINIGTNGTAANLFNVLDTGSSLFSVSETAVTSNLPTNFTSAGDVGIAYDLNFTNATASYVKSLASFYLQAGETFGSSDLNLNTFNKGNVIVNSEAFVVNGAATISSTLLVQSTASVSGALSLYGTPTIASTAMQSLTLGNASTGRIQFYDTSNYLDTSGNLTLAGNIVAGTYNGATLNNTTLSGTSSYTITGGTGSGNTLTLISSTHGTKGNIQFFDTTNYITSAGNAVFAGSLSVGSSATVSGALTLYGTSTVQSTANKTLTLGGDTTGWINFAPLNTSTLTIKPNLLALGTATIDGTGTLSLNTTNNQQITTGTGAFNVMGAATVSASLALGPQSTAPATCNAANEGRVYYQGTTGEKKLYYCNGTSWTALATGSGGDTSSTISPEFPGAVISADGSNNTGTFTSDREATGSGSLYNFNYYEFTSAQSSLQDYDVYVRYKIPENFSSWTTSNALTVDFETEDTTNTNNKIDVTIYQDNDADTVTSTANVSNYASTWHSSQTGGTPISFTAAQLNTGLTWSAGSIMTVKIKLYSKDNYFARVGSIKFDWQ